jgi:hypothetical protein
MISRDAGSDGVEVLVTQHGQQHTLEPLNLPSLGKDLTEPLNGVRGPIESEQLGTASRDPQKAVNGRHITGNRLRPNAGRIRLDRVVPGPRWSPRGVPPQAGRHTPQGHLFLSSRTSRRIRRSTHTHLILLPYWMQAEHRRQHCWVAGGKRGVLGPAKTVG